MGVGSVASMILFLMLSSSGEQRSSKYNFFLTLESLSLLPTVGIQIPVLCIHFEPLECESSFGWFFKD